MPDYYLSPSTRKDKRYMVRFADDNKTIHFGSATGRTFIDHKNDEKQKAWISRHSKLNEDWTADGIRTAGWWSRWLLWSKPSLRSAMKLINKKFKLYGIVELK